MVVAAMRGGFVSDQQRRDRDRMDRMVVVMEDWADWMKVDDSRIGFPGHSALVRGAPGCSYERAESGRAELVDAAVSDLDPIQRAAIQKRYKVCSVWRFPRANYAEVLDKAHASLLVLLRKKGVDLDS
jgi:hypothetical protein